jgi:hypothetical protein
MKLTQKLLGHLHKVFCKDPLPFSAIAFQCDGTDMVWAVSDGTLTTAPIGGSASPLSIDLSQYTLTALASYIATQPGYYVTMLVAGSNKLLSSLVLMDSTGSQADGVTAIAGYTNVLWALMEANASELKAAADSIQTLPGQMATTTAQNVFLDLLGSYYNVPRYTGESDALYGPRIIATVIRPANNNVAIEMAIQQYTGQLATVTDVVLRGVTGNSYNGEHIHDGSINHNSASTNIYGLFDVTYSYDLISGGDLTAFAQTVVALVNTLRAAGTHMRSISLSGSVLSDRLTPPTDTFTLLQIGASFTDALTPPTEPGPKIQVSFPAPFADTLTPPQDGLGLVVTTNYQYNAVRTYNGIITHRGNSTSVESVGSSSVSAIRVADGSKNADGSASANALVQ